MTETIITVAGRAGAPRLVQPRSKREVAADLGPGAVVIGPLPSPRAMRGIVVLPPDELVDHP